MHFFFSLAHDIYSLASALEFFTRNISRRIRAITDVTVIICCIKKKGDISRTLLHHMLLTRSSAAYNGATLYFVRAGMPQSQFPRTYDHFHLMHCCQFAARYCHDLDKLAHVSKTVTQKRLITHTSRSRHLPHRG